MFTDFDRFAMTRALELAQRGLETADPNPRVGCVIAKSDRILAEGWHARAGEAHAEAAALRDTTEAVAGATAYVTLEPCSHHGRTAPCTDALIAARVARVVFAIEDPNPRVSGNGAAALRHAGIAVEAGLLAAESTELNVGFLKRMRLGLPWVRVKLAMSLDGRTALANGASQWITGEQSRHDVQLWRARSSAVLTGIGTLLADDPHLNVRLPERTRQPLRVVLDSQLRAPPGASIFSTAGEVVLFTEDSMQPQRASAASLLESQGAKVEIVPSQEGRLDLTAVLTRLAELEVNELLVEAGPILAGQFLTRSLADELLLYIAPKLLGPQGRALVDIPQLESLDEASSYSLLDQRRLGDDLCLRLRPQ